MTVSINLMYLRKTIYARYFSWIHKIISAVGLTETNTHLAALTIEHNSELVTFDEPVRNFVCKA